MTQSHAAGWAPDSPTPAQLKEFFSQISTGKITKDSLQAFLRGESVVSLTEAEQKALKILGEGRVIGYKDACRIWQVGQPEIEPAMPYNEEILHQVAERNHSDEDWRLVYCTGLSLRSQFEVMGNDREKQPCFDKNYMWWHENQQGEWANKGVKAGYRLLDFSCPFTSQNWQQQNDAIVASGEQFARAEEQAVTEACFSNFVQNAKEHLLRNRYHWGYLPSANGYLVCVGGFGDFGFYVNNYWDDGVYDILGAVRVWKSA